MTWPELVEKLLDRLEAQGENMSKERAEFGVDLRTKGDDEVGD